MKRILAVLLSAAAILSSTVSMRADGRKEILKVYNWASYIDEAAIGDFEQWYYDHTGEHVTVSYMNFDVNEAMLSKIEKGHEDYDVVFPSDYIIERMLNTDLLLPLDFSSLPDSLNYIESTKSPFIENMFRSINKSIDANKYAVGYMWGTTGILYNKDMVRTEDALTWDVLRNPWYSGQILLKDAPRDVYAPVLIYLKQNELADGSVTLDDLMMDSSDESLAAVKAFLMQSKLGVCGFEADLGKEQMIKERAAVSLNWSGDAVWTIREAARVGVNLGYEVPLEGSTIWFDGMVIPKYSQNVKAATWFIDFMCRPDIAIRNMDEIGYVSCNGAPEVMESQIDSTYAPVDLSYMFGEDATAVCVDPVLYPDKSVIERCALEHDWGDRTEELLSMWQAVKSSEVSASTLIVVGLFLVGLVAFIIFSPRRRKSHRH